MSEVPLYERIRKVDIKLPGKGNAKLPHVTRSARNWSVSAITGMMLRAVFVNDVAGGPCDMGEF